MKTFTLLLLLACGICARAEEMPSAALRVMSFNIRNSAAKDGENAWPNRKALFLETIRKFDPDLLGLQEVMADQHDQLVAAFPDYGAVGVARTDGARKGEWSLILYRKARFAERESNTFWLSEQPEVVGSRGWDAALERICSWVKLRDQSTGRDLLFANTHFDHKGLTARVQSAALLRERLAKVAGGIDTVLTGDFNSIEDGEAYGTLVSPPAAAPTSAGLAFFDSYRQVHPTRAKDEASAHGFRGTTKGSRIDWILHTAHFAPASAEIVRTRSAGHFPSDHYAVTAVLAPK